MYSYDKVVKFVHEEDVKFIRLAFFDVFGVQKNISIMPGELLKRLQMGFLLMLRQSPDLAMKSKAICFFIRIRKLFPYYHGVPQTAV